MTARENKLNRLELFDTECRVGSKWGKRGMKLAEYETPFIKSNQIGIMSC
jgi:hypothetical protein